ncbi:MAG TPA: glycosyltransferase family 2 protein [Edaphocola sp.]|nr:glycosyltransferase family 2 protein [Edaphocola sp.]
MLDLTVIVPLLNEEESLPELAAWIDKVAKEQRLQYEIIFVDDGSTDNSWSVIKDLSIANPNIRGIKFQRNYGKSAALNEAFQEALGAVVITMDADLQDSPDEIPELIQMINEDGFDLVSGWKKKRYDNKLTKNLPSKLFNGVTSKISGIHLHDFNCGLKAYRNKVVKHVEVYGEMHRYIPVLAKNAGFNKIGEKVVQHQARKYGTSKFGWNRFVNGFLDLLTVQFIGRFRKKPMHFFGLWGAIMFLIGFLTTAYLIIAKFIWWDEYSVSTRPPFYMALTLLIIGTMFFLAGYIAELLVRNAPDRNRYSIDEKLRI